MREAYYLRKEIHKYVYIMHMCKHALQMTHKSILCHVFILNTFKALFWFIFCCFGKTLTKARGKGQFIWPACYSQSLTRVRTETQMETWGRNWSRNNGETLLPGLLPLACPTTFLVQLRTTCPEITPPTRGITLLPQLANKKIPLQTGPHTSLKESVLHMMLPLPRCVKMTATMTGTLIFVMWFTEVK